MINEEDILVTGGTGMVGFALKNIIPGAQFVGSKDYDLTQEQQVSKMLTYYKPKYIVHLAAKVGGIKANIDNVGSFFYDNIKINSNVLEQSRLHKVEKVVSLLSTCIYPHSAKYPLTENQIHLGAPHFSNFGYAYAKRMLDVQSRAYRQQYNCNFITAVPNNLFGENDNFHLQNSHVIPALIRKIYDAKLNGKSKINLWGTGEPLREFTYSKDVAKILLFLLKKYNGVGPINIGNTNEYSIKYVVDEIFKIFEYECEVFWDTKKPSGQYKKPSCNDNLTSLGWEKNNYTNFDIALKKTCEWFIINYPNIRGV